MKHRMWPIFVLLVPYSGDEITIALCVVIITIQDDRTKYLIELSKMINLPLCFWFFDQGKFGINTKYSGPTKACYCVQGKK